MNKRVNMEYTKKTKWALELTIAPGKSVPFTDISAKSVRGELKGQPYEVNALRGNFERGEGTRILRIYPENGMVVLDCDLSK